MSLQILIDLIEKPRLRHSHTTKSLSYPLNVICMILELRFLQHSTDLYLMMPGVHCVVSMHAGEANVSLSLCYCAIPDITVQQAFRRPLARRMCKEWPRRLWFLQH